MKLRFTKFLFSIGFFVLVFKPTMGFGDTTANHLLLGSSWIGKGVSGDPGLNLSHVLHFNSDNLIIESTCSDGVISSTMKSEIAITYLDDTTAKLTVGLISKIPAGYGNCYVNFPATLEFHVDAELMSIGYDGSYQPTHMKRQN